MRSLRVVNQRGGIVLGDRILHAHSWFSRLRGLLGRPAPGPGEGLMLTPCRVVHMFGMRYPIDVAFLDRAGVVVAIYPRLAPGAGTSWHRSARHALELPSGALARTGTAVGDRLSWSAADSRQAGRGGSQVEARL
jgi:uncharacterized membrane protein (UPF0127 family)